MQIDATTSGLLGGIPLRGGTPSRAAGTDDAIAALDAPDQAGADFGRQVADAVGQVNDLQVRADEAVLNGSTEDAHQAMLAMEHASLALDFSLQVRNKVIEAYQEVMRTQL